MSHIQRVRVGDIGVVIILTVYEDGAVKDISSATNLEIHIKKPGGTVLEKTAAFTTNGTDGKLQYTTQSDGFTEEGYYEVRGNFTLNTWSGSTTEMFVLAEAIE